MSNKPLEPWQQAIDREEQRRELLHRLAVERMESQERKRKERERTRLMNKLGAKFKCHVCK